MIYQNRADPIPRLQNASPILKAHAELPPFVNRPDHLPKKEERDYFCFVREYLSTKKIITCIIFLTP